MASDLHQIAAFPDAHQADMLRAALAEHGITAWLDGDNAGVTLSYVGSALGGVRVLVPAADARRASQIMQSLADSDDADDTPWYCAACDEHIEAGFAVCWSCGRPREEVAGPAPPAAAPPEPVEPEPSIPAAPHPGYQHRNPYASPEHPPGDPAPAPADPFGQNPAAEALLVRAWRVSVIGIVFIPVLSHCYSMYLLIQASLEARTFSPAGTRRYYSALIINLFILALFSVVLLA